MGWLQTRLIHWPSESLCAQERPLNHPLIVHVNGIEQAQRVAHFTRCARELVERFWPGPLSLILPRKEVVPDEVTAGLQTVAVRCPNHSDPVIARSF